MTLVKRILVTHVPWLENLRKTVEWHNPHTISKAMTQKTTQKSTTVNLGVVEATPASTAGVCDIMDQFHT